MCIGIPMQVISSDGYVAICEADGERQQVDMSLLGEQAVGSWVLVFLGAARELLSEQRAFETAQAIKALRSVMANDGADIDELFADLTERSPQLPEHLQAQYQKQSQTNNQEQKD
ncbi:HypC/HybG/HupF family hydrogenase formation chaperone [Amphritea balenae]|uniref:HypC/HybG/HupF family hydrogenase formation chaperone n=1 Tax=Amphritea balenae TaxID=452629 RepID=A0A3P1SV49_9GAMM|nr:HypC/HybG/HupF family hydrogenase formation chaperone [Amphritea balenae]RRD01029.1 HypC/HybG/HupF family hydrogenase formation chaperone [Amphritea balenae]GGK60574.1 hydrogenase [Amphritea balenae]